MKRLLWMLPGLLAGCAASVPGPDDLLLDNQSAFGAPGLSVLVAREGASARVTILSARNLNRAEAAAIAVKAAREATACSDLTPLEVEPATAATAETHVRVALAGCSA